MNVSFFYLISNKLEVALKKGPCSPACIPALFVQRRLRWFGHVARRPDGELPTPPRTWRGRTGDQLKAWANTIKPDLEPLSGPRVFGYARWRNDWVPAHDRRDVDNSIGEVLGECRHKYKLVVKHRPT